MDANTQERSLGNMWKRHKSGSRKPKKPQRQLWKKPGKASGNPWGNKGGGNQGKQGRTGYGWNWLLWTKMTKMKCGLE